MKEITPPCSIKDVNVVIYHANCMDGFASAHAIWKVKGYNCEYIAEGYYGINSPDVVDKHVMICDYSYDYKTLSKMIDDAKSLIIIDHHKSAEIKLKEIPERNKIFDMNHSGAYLTWKYCFPGKDIPKYILYVEDRDIWTKRLPYTDEFYARFKSVKHDFKEYDKMLDDKYIYNIIDEGKLIRKYECDQMDRIIQSSSVKTVILDNETYQVAYIQSNVHLSDLGNKMLTYHPKSDFAAVSFYDYKNNYTKFSLRSCDDRIDVSEVAEKFNGGGHRNAAGFSAIGFWNDLEKLYKYIILSNKKV